MVNQIVTNTFFRLLLLVLELLKKTKNKKIWGQSERNREQGGRKAKTCTTCFCHVHSSDYLLNSEGEPKGEVKTVKTGAPLAKITTISVNITTLALLCFPLFRLPGLHVYLVHRSLLCNSKMSL